MEDRRYLIREVAYDGTAYFAGKRYYIDSKRADQDAYIFEENGAFYATFEDEKVYRCKIKSFFKLTLEFSIFGFYFSYNKKSVPSPFSKPLKPVTSLALGKQAHKRAVSNTSKKKTRKGS